MRELDGTRTISIPALSFNYVDNRLESIGTCGELYYRERGACVPYAGTRWHDLFGTPERAARTLADLQTCSLGFDLECDECAVCSLCQSDARNDRDALLGWLRGENDGE